jgi:hypothetical protein
MRLTVIEKPEGIYISFPLSNTETITLPLKMAIELMEQLNLVLPLIIDL